MTFDELDNEICGRSTDGPLKVHGKIRHQVLALAIASCPESGKLSSIGGSAFDWRNVLHKRVSAKYHQQYGLGIIGLAIISAIISGVVRALVAWWLDSEGEATATIAALKSGSCDGT